MARQPILDPGGLARATERIASLVPGYSGYKSREKTGEEDRALRSAVHQQLGLTLGRLERALAQTAREIPSEDVDQAGNLLRMLGRHRDRIRFVPSGAGSFFAQKRIHLQDLEGLVALDAGLWSVLEELDRLAAAWDAQSRRGRTEWPREGIREALIGLEDLIEEREAYLRS
jgi:hypothetical protein